jgi:hypothetical protein
MLKRDHCNQRGSGLLQALIVVAIGGILIDQISSTIVAMNAESKFLTEKIATLELDRVVRSAMVSSDVCNQVILQGPASKFQFPTTAFPPAAGSTIPLNALYSGAGPTPLAIVDGPLDPVNLPDGLKVSSIQISRIAGVSPNFIAQLDIGFKDSTRGIRDVSVPISIDTATVSGTTSIIGCRPNLKDRCELMGGTWTANPVGDGTGTCNSYIGEAAVSIFRRDGSGGVIEISRLGPVDAIITLLNQYAYPGSDWAKHSSNGNFDGAACNLTKGWRLAGCFGGWLGQSDFDIIPYTFVQSGMPPVVAGCLTNDGKTAEFVIQCIKNF